MESCEPSPNKVGGAKMKEAMLADWGVEDMLDTVGLPLSPDFFSGVSSRLPSDMSTA